MDFDYTVKTSKNFDDAVHAIESEIAEHGMRVLHIHDVQKTLADKGFSQEPFKIIEFCNAKHANKLLNTNGKIGLYLPCKINVYSQSEEIFISGMRPVVLKNFFPEDDLGNIPEEVDQTIQSIINESK